MLEAAEFWLVYHLRLYLDVTCIHFALMGFVVPVLFRPLNNNLVNLGFS